jgi:hypothetical protein
MRRDARRCSRAISWFVSALVSACGGGGGGGSSQPASSTPAPATPVPVVSLTAAAATVIAGLTTNLTWSATNATSCTASGGWSGVQPISGSASVTVNQQTTFSLTCSGAGGTSGAQVSVGVDPPTVSMTANPTSVTAGTSATIVWSSTGATSCMSGGGWTGTQSTSGSASVAVSQQTTFSLVCTGPGGSGNGQVSIGVDAPKVSVTANRASVVAGTDATVTWSSIGATSCIATGGWTGAKPTSGSAALTVDRETTFSLTCDGAGGRGSAQVTVAIVPRWLNTRGIKLWMNQNAQLFNEYTGVPPDLGHYELWHDVLRQVRADGATEVTFLLSTGVMVNATDNDYSSTISFNAPQQMLLALAQDARSQGLAVTVNFFSNVLNVITGSGGLDRPNPSDFATWFANHRIRVLDAARLARALDARTMIYMNDETQHLLRDPTHAAQWAQLVRDVRAEFSGIVTTGWWTPGGGDSISAISPMIIAELDYLGIGLFPNLVRAEEPDVQTLCNAYHHDADGHDVIGFLESLYHAYGKRIWITDKAFHSFKGASYDEWRVFDSTIPLTSDEDMQVRLFESFFGALSTANPAWLEGVSMENFNNLKDGANPGIARFVDSPVSESPQHKLAEKVLSDWFNGRRSMGC